MKAYAFILCIMILTLIGCYNKNEKADILTRQIPDSSISKYSSGPGDSLLTFHFFNAELTTVMDSLEKRANYNFCYCPPVVELFGRRINFSIERCAPSKILQLVIEKEKDLNFIVEGKTVIVYSKRKLKFI